MMDEPKRIEDVKSSNDCRLCGGDGYEFDSSEECLHCGGTGYDAPQLIYTRERLNESLQRRLQSGS